MRVCNGNGRLDCKCKMKTGNEAACHDRRKQSSCGRRRIRRKYKCRNGHHEREGSFPRKNDKRGDSRRTFDDDCRSQKSLIRNRQKANVLYPERER